MGWLRGAGAREVARACGAIGSVAAGPECSSWAAGLAAGPECSRWAVGFVGANSGAAVASPRSSLWAVGHAGAKFGQRKWAGLLVFMRLGQADLAGSH